MPYSQLKLTTVWRLVAVTVIVSAFQPELDASALVPAGLNPGDPYHLIFITQGGMDATSANIADYNTFANAQAALNPSLTGTNMGVNWYAMGSTPTVDARNNAVVSAPVYAMDGLTKVADSFADIWDGTIDATLEFDQFGVAKPNQFRYWTGSQSSGFASGLFPLSATDVQFGRVGTTVGSWMQSGALPRTGVRSIVALSDRLITPIPEPRVMSLMGLVAISLLRLRWEWTPAVSASCPN